MKFLKIKLSHNLFLFCMSIVRVMNVTVTSKEVLLGPTLFVIFWSHYCMIKPYSTNIKCPIFFFRNFIVKIR